MKTELKFFICIFNSDISSYYEGKGFDKMQAVSDIKSSTLLKGDNFFKKNSTVVSTSCIFSLAGNIIGYTPNQGTNRGKNFNLIIYEGKSADFGVE